MDLTNVFKKLKTQLRISPNQNLISLDSKKHLPNNYYEFANLIFRKKKILAFLGLQLEFVKIGEKSVPGPNNIHLKILNLRNRVKETYNLTFEEKVILINNEEAIAILSLEIEYWVYLQLHELACKFHYDKRFPQLGDRNESEKNLENFGKICFFSFLKEKIEFNREKLDFSWQSTLSDDSKPTFDKISCSLHNITQCISCSTKFCQKCLSNFLGAESIFHVIKVEKSGQETWTDGCICCKLGIFQNFEKIFDLVQKGAFEEKFRKKLLLNRNSAYDRLTTLISEYFFAEEKISEGVEKIDFDTTKNEKENDGFIILS